MTELDHLSQEELAAGLVPSLCMRFTLIKFKIIMIHHINCSILLLIYLSV